MGQRDRSRKAELAAYKSEVITQNAEQEAARQRTYSLEIRGAGIGIYEDHQSEIWEFIKRKTTTSSLSFHETLRIMTLHSTLEKLAQI